MSNSVMFQYFEWYLEDDCDLWCQLEREAPKLAQIGFDAIWIPPAYKSAGGQKDTGYAPYDLWDLGEFDQKGAVPTKYGTKEELIQAIKAVHQNGMGVLADIVLNHKDGGDEKERFRAVSVKKDQRTEDAGEEHDIEAWTSFTFPGRGDKHSKLKWHWHHFTAASYDAKSGNGDQVLRFSGKQFDQDVDKENGNFDYLMANDIDHNNPEVREDLMAWGVWLVETLGINGFRLDAVKHISSQFYKDWLHHVRSHFPGQDLFAVGEYWRSNEKSLQEYLQQVEGTMSLFDVPLQKNFHQASKSHNKFDMRQILDGSLMKDNPTKAVTFVENHDTQPCQSLESPVEDWFKPLAYSLILLRDQGYPCVFYGDYYGAHYPHETEDGHVTLPALQPLLDKLIQVRKEHCWGLQEDYFDHPNTIGWVRLGDKEHAKAVAVVMGNGDEGSKRMCVQRPGGTFVDITGDHPEPITVGKDGWGIFPHRAGSVSVWLQQ